MSVIAISLKVSVIKALPEVGSCNRTENPTEISIHARVLDEKMSFLIQDSAYTVHILACWTHTHMHMRARTHTLLRSVVSTAFLGYGRVPVHCNHKLQRDWGCL